MRKPLVAPKTPEERQALIDKYNQETGLDLGTDLISKTATPAERQALEAGFDIDPRYVKLPPPEPEELKFVDDKTAILVLVLFVLSCGGVVCSSF